jgi:uncharacterized protein YkwD
VIETSAWIETAIPPEEDTFTQAMRLYFHKYRAEHGGLPLLTWHSGAAAVAQANSLDMEATGHFSHTNTAGLSPGQRLRSAGISCYCGENIAGGSREAHDIIDAWDQSADPQHKLNMLVVPPQFTHYAFGRSLGYYWTYLLLGGLA